MSIEKLHTLADLIRRESHNLLAEWRREVRQLSANYQLDVPTLNDHVPELLEELAAELESLADDSMIRELRKTSVTHGLDRLRLGFNIEEVVAEYNALRGLIHELIETHALDGVRGQVNRTVNRVIDLSIGIAVKTFAAQKAAEIEARREEYLSFVAHDLRTPLSAIAMAAKMLAIVAPNSMQEPRAAQLLATMHRNVARLNALIVNILAENSDLKSKIIEKIERSTINLRLLVEALINDLMPLTDAAKASLKNEIPDDLTIFADAEMLTLIFQNLISNAVKHAPGGEIVIGAQNLTEHSAVECWVSDNGVGIAAELLPKIFDKLETGSRETGGIGLGLAIVKQFVEAHGGQIMVDSQIQHGATFQFIIPNQISLAAKQTKS